MQHPSEDIIQPGESNTVKEKMPDIKQIYQVNQYLKMIIKWNIQFKFIPIVFLPSKKIHSLNYHNLILLQDKDKDMRKFWHSKTESWLVHGGLREIYWFHQNTACIEI